MQRLDLTNGRFEKLIVLERAENKGQKTRWRCRCDCGNETVVSTGNLREGKTASCGCVGTPIRSEMARSRNMVHGHNRKGEATPTWVSWRSMLSRCTRKKHRSYPDYGGRGIAVCDRWKEDFREFLADMGERPDGKTLDRIDVNGHYEPENCRWATRSEQQKNKRRK